MFAFRLNSLLSWQGQDFLGRSITQAVSRRPPTATARVRYQVKSCRICGEQSGTGAGFLGVLMYYWSLLSD
jgi:hypothetical protein